jgi:type IVB pilus formation R64 PilN family outer membrane protein
VWKDVQGAVAVIVGERGRFALTPSNGTLTVTSSPAVLAQVARFVRTQNDILTRQVFIRMKIYSVEAGEGDDAGFKITSFFENAAKTAGVNWISPGSSLTPAAGSLDVNIMGSSSQWNGSKVVAQALSTSAKSTLLNELTLTALNNRPVVRQEVRTQSYIERTSVTEQERSTTTEITPAKLSTGFTASVLPRIISENRILLQYAINLSTLIRFDKGESGTSSVQLPTFDASSGWQETSLRSGEVLVLLGFLSNKANDRREGTGHPDNFLFGGTRAASTQVRRVVITLEPVIVSGVD